MRRDKARGHGLSTNGRYTIVAAAVLGIGIALAIFTLRSPVHATAGSTLPSFTIVSPRNGSTVENPVKLQVVVKGAKIGTPMSGRDHLHVSVDGGQEQAVYRNRVFSLNLPPGRNTISVELAYPTHEPVMPPKSVSFDVQ